MQKLGAELQAKHPSVGAVRSIGLFGIVELIRDRKTRQPMAPFNGTSDEMVALGKFSARTGSTPSFDGIRSSPILRCASTSSRCGGVCDY